MPTYGRQDVSFVRGEGAWLFDKDGKRYLDALSGIAVCGLGHAHPAVTEAIQSQAATLLHSSNLFQIESQALLADKLCAISGLDNAFFCNSGAEANETAIKLARKFGHDRGHKNPAIVVMDGAFHGRTMATLSATGNRKIQAGFEPLVSGFVRAPFNDLDAVRTIGQNNTDVVAVLVEPVQGERGIRVPDPGYLQGLREICDAHGWLLMLDEVQTGNGRTGRYFAYQHENIVPDVVTTAKGLGNGVPISCCLAGGEAADVLKPGSHGTTFGGNALVTKAALAVVDTIESDGFLEHVNQLAEQLHSGLASLQQEGMLSEWRQHGLMFGLDLGVPCAELVPMALNEGLVINVTGETTLRLLPPLILNRAEAEQLIGAVRALVEDFWQKHGAEQRQQTSA